MKKLLLLLFLSVFAFCGVSQIAFYKIYGGSEYDFGYDLVQTPDSGYLITGTSGSFREGHADAYLLKVDKYGWYQWSAPYGGPENETANEMVYDQSVGVYLVGSSNSWSESGGYNLYVAHMEESGNLLWERTYYGEDWEQGIEAEMTQDQGLFIGINRQGTNTDDQDISLMRLDTNGDSIWRMDFTMPGHDEITDIERYQDSLFVVSSNRYDTTTALVYPHVMVMHEDGSIIVEDTIRFSNTTSDFRINDFFMSGDTLYGIGSWTQNDSITMDVRHYRYKITSNSIDNIQNTTFHSSAVWSGDVITNNFDNSWRFGSHGHVGTWTAPVGGDTYIALHTEQLFWVSLIGTISNTGDDKMSEGIPTLDGGAAMIGSVGGPGGSNIGLIKIGPNFTYPSIDNVTFVEQLVGMDDLGSLNGISLYPNPASDFVMVRSTEKNVTAFEVLAMNGAIQQSGTLEASGKISVSGLSSGMYLVRLKDGATLLGTARLIVR